jgi:ribosomal protein S18 acetylase RimI-like enzyme
VPDSNFQLRDYKPEDFKKLWELDQTCFADGIAYSVDDLKHFVSHEMSFTIVGEREGKIQGFIIVQRDLKRTGHVITIDVHADARRAGLGTLLMSAAEKRLAAENCNSVLLEVAVDNAPAISFYKRHGYSVLKTIPRYYNNSLDALMLGKTISSQ